MHRIVRDSDITLYSRYECKYVVSPLLVPQIRAFLEPFMQPDTFAALREGHRYPVCSLYLDSEDLLLYQQTVGGEKNRFKLRARSYSDDPAAPVFLEVKRKINNIVQKRRARLDRAVAAEGLRRGFPRFREIIGPDALGDLAYFASHVELTGAKPVVRVRYMREAYESRGGDPVRVTIDTELAHAVTLGEDFSRVTGRWVGTRVPGAILEIKFTERFPSWIAHFVRTCGLKQQAVPKYVLSVDHMLMEGRESVVSIAGFRLPVRRV